MPRLAFTKIIAQCTWNRMQRAVPPSMRLVHCVLLNLRAWIVSTKLNNPPREATGSNFVSEICSRSRFFRLCEVVQIFQRESIFCSKISSGGPYLSKNLFRGEPGSIFISRLSRSKIDRLGSHDFEDLRGVKCVTWYWKQSVLGLAGSDLRGLRDPSLRKRRGLVTYHGC